MEKFGNVAIFMDYNGTFDDLEQGKGQAMIFALRKFVELFDNAEIVVVTGAKSAPEHCSIRPELSYCLSRFSFLSTHVTHLIEENCRSICDVVQDGDQIRYVNEKYLAPKFSSKKVAVEEYLRKFDTESKISCCVFVGDDEKFDVEMLKSDVSPREKFMIYANRKNLKSNKPLKLCKVPHSAISLHSTADFLNENLANEMNQTFQSKDEIVFHTDKNSYGVGMGFGALTNYLIFRKQEFDKQKTSTSQETDEKLLQEKPRER